MAESHAYGTSLFCISRRVYVLFFCMFMTAICFVQLFAWIVQAKWIRDLFFTGKESHGCTGVHCYEVFTCEGMQDVTNHLLQPLCTLTGCIFFPLGINAAHHGYRTRLEVLAAYLFAGTAWLTGTYLFDIVYYETCNAYTRNILDDTVLSPLSSVPIVQQDAVKKLASFPIKAVNALTHDFPAFTIYWVVLLLDILFFFYTAWQVYYLAMLMEKGPIGLGAHYGLDQWDEVLSREALATRKRRQQGNKVPFIEDAKLIPEKDIEAPYGFLYTPGFYGGTDYDSRAALKDQLKMRAFQGLNEEVRKEEMDMIDRQFDLIQDQLDWYEEEAAAAKEEATNFRWAQEQDMEYSEELTAAEEEDYEIEEEERRMEEQANYIESQIHGRA